jgi:hypothetical protein
VCMQKIYSGCFVSGVLTVAIMLSGCTASFNPKPTATSLPGIHLISNTASLSNTYIIDSNSPLRYCSQPPPDAGFSQAESSDISLVTLGDKKEAGGESEQSGEIEMQGRTPSVLLTRELLYRLCEFSNNQHLTAGQSIELYKLNLEIIKSVSTAVANNTTSKITISDKLTSSTDASSVKGQPLPSLNEDDQMMTQPDTSTNQNDQMMTQPDTSTNQNECNDNLDNDNDGSVDYEDPQCMDADSLSES